MTDLEEAIERNGIDEAEDAESMSESEIVKFLAKKTKSEMTDPRFSPYINRIKNSPEMLKALQIQIMKNSALKTLTSEENGQKNEPAPESGHNHKVLKGALYLLERYKSASRESFLLNGHRPATLRRLLPLILRVRCDKKSVNDLVQDLVKSVIDSYSTIELNSQLNPAAIDIVRSLNNTETGQNDFEKEREKSLESQISKTEDFVELKSELMKIMNDEKLTWTRRFNAYLLFSRFLLRLDLDLSTEDVEILVKELTNERPKWQIIAFQMTQTVLHKIKRVRPREYLTRSEVSDIPAREDLMYEKAFTDEESWNSARIYGDRTHLGYSRKDRWTQTVKRQLFKNSSGLNNFKS